MYEKQNDSLTVVVLIALLVFIAALFAKDSFGGKLPEPTWTTETRRIMLVDESMIDLYLMSLKAVNTRVIEQMVLDKKAVRLPPGTKVTVGEKVKALDDVGGGIYKVKAGEQVGWMIVTGRQLKKIKGMEV